MNPEAIQRELIIKFIETFTKIDGKKQPLYPYQKKFLRDTNTFRIVNKARQLGFSFIIADEGTIEGMLDANSRTLYVSSSEDSAKRVLTYCKQCYNSIPNQIRPELVINSSSEMQFQDEKTKKAGGLLVSLPSNPKTIRGFRATRVYIDEAAHFRDDEELLRAIQPSISRGGKLTILSTPCGRSNKFFEIWDKDENYSKHRITWEDCPDPVYRQSILRLKQTMDAISFAQEYECNFHEDALAFFPEKIISPCVKTELQQHFELKARGVVYMGIDWAKKQDSTAIIVAEHFVADNLLIVRRIETFQNVSYETQLINIFEICKSLDVEQIFCDMTGVGERLYEDLTNRSGCNVEGINFTLQNKELLITNLRILFENEKIMIPKHAMLISQLRSLERSYTPTGNVRFRHVSDSHDDLVWCYDDKTKILTDNGWKYFKDLEDLDKVAQLYNNELVFGKPKKIISFDYNDKMIEIKSRQVDLLVTPNHKCFVALSKGGNEYQDFKLIEANKLYNKHFRIKKDAKWNGKLQKTYIRVPRIKNCKNNKIHIPINTFLEFLGYYLSEGYISKNKNKIIIAQKFGTYKYEKIKKLLEKIYKFREIKGGFEISSKRIASTLPTGLSYQKFIPTEYKNLPKKQLKILLNAMMLGDGSRNLYYTSSLKLAEDFSEIAIKCGYGINIGQINRIGRPAKNGIARHIEYRVSLVSKSNPRLNHHKKSHIRDINYSGKVYCCETDTGIIMVMRNGFSSWCGNSLSLVAHNCSVKNVEVAYEMGNKLAINSIYSREETEDMAKLKTLF